MSTRDNNTNKPRKKPADAPKSEKAVRKTRASASPVKEGVAAIVETENTTINESGQALTQNKMEVHHHPELVHKPKPWKEYLLEGFMIFIAVMMGFIAENIREGITDNEHATQLTLRLVQDLKADTAQLNNIIEGETRIRKGNDTLINLLQQPPAKADLIQIQQLTYRSHSLWPFHPSNGAINAIKSELHLKQFSNSDIITYISNYEGTFTLLQTVQDITLQYQHTYLDPFLFDHFTPANLDSVFSKKPPKDAQMRNLTQADLTHLATCMVLVRVNTDELLRCDTSLRHEAVDLLKYVNKQYHLKQ